MKRQKLKELLKTIVLEIVNPLPNIKNNKIIMESTNKYYIEYNVIGKGHQTGKTFKDLQSAVDFGKKLVSTVGYKSNKNYIGIDSDSGNYFIILYCDESYLAESKSSDAAFVNACRQFIKTGKMQIGKHL